MRTQGLRAGRSVTGRGWRNGLASDRSRLYVVHDVGARRRGALARLFARSLGRFVGLGLPDEELFFGLPGAARQRRELIRSEEQRADDENADDNRRVDDREHRMYGHDSRASVSLSSSVFAMPGAIGSNALLASSTKRAICARVAAKPPSRSIPSTMAGIDSLGPPS